MPWLQHDKIIFGCLVFYLNLILLKHNQFHYMLII